MHHKWLQTLISLTHASINHNSIDSSYLFCYFRYASLTLLSLLRNSKKPWTIKPLIMKKTFVTLFALLTIGITASIADPGTNVDPRILSAFQKEFSFAKNVRWQEEGTLARVNFFLNDQMVSAWYNSDAQLVTTARNILYHQVPISVMRSLDKAYEGTDILAITEISRNDETYYQIRVDKKGKKYLLKASPSGNIIVLKKIK